jgi:spore coat polysaccharide biosynthesis protein SpsF
MTKILTIIQARSGSSRLPGKVTLPLCGSTLLERMVERVLMAEHVQEIVIATTLEEGDDCIADICLRRGWNCYRGHSTDLLDRHYRAALPYSPDVVVKIPSDVPLIDPAVIDRVFSYYLAHSHEVDFVSNLHPNCYPDGMDVEMIRFSVLEIAWREASLGFEREHTTPFIWERPERFRLANVTYETGEDLSMTHRFTIDYPEDYDFILAVYSCLYPQNPRFSLRDILNLLKERPDIYEKNAKFAGVNWYRNHLGKLKTIASHQTKKI